MAYPKHSILQNLTVLLLAWVLVQSQPPLQPGREDEEEANATTEVKSELIECPPECSCMADGVVDCAGLDLTEFPAELSDQTRQLSLQVGPHINANAHPPYANVGLNPHAGLSVFVLEQQNRDDNSGAHFPSATA